ncbi:non-ribosomal peptide synthetase [Abyssisolibacter fermentans]|uniref:non-ribosomal peptide synthetase n=1 Tax=Abyssisolibacter fermentans TaxID=1766203 RepID=UPI00082F3BC4|nr:non-ribosomal peptide synthetase [Abyssisolibacter fermentans]
MKEKKTIKNSDNDSKEKYILSESEKNKLLIDFNNTKHFYSKDKTIHELFEEQVDKTSDEIAVIFEENKLTYRELNQRANQLARTLRENQVKTDEIVAIMLERSIEMIVCIIAVLKAGGAYLPIDYKYPKSRIEYMLKDSNSKLILTQNSLINLIKDLPIDVINVKNKSSYKEDNRNLYNINNPNDLIYVIYTSGSTGKPKGVMLEHRSVVNYIKFAQENYLENGIGNFPLFTSIAFDLTVTSIYTPLLSGKTIIIYNDVNDLPLEKIIYSRADVVKMTPAHLSILSELDINKRSVKKLIIGGEYLTNRLAKKINNKFDSEIEIYNEYGPTEVTVGCIVYKYSENNQNGISVPIGKPINNTEVYILDKSLSLVPIGVEGEIYISGDGLARGYLNRPDLTKERFIDNPFVPNEKMYKTGDRAKWRVDGNIEFLGRIDDQVKIRGYRIELGEIENKLIKHEDINEAVVLAKKEDENKFLCAYVVAKKELTHVNIREYLSKELPDYMIPSYITQLNTLPLTSNGKIDKKTLLEIKVEVNKALEYAAPEDEIQKKLVKIWEKTLNINKIGINDNFFDLGGHSLKAMILISKIHKELNISISVNEIFNVPTIKEMSQYVMNLNEEKYYSLKSVEKKEYYELSPAQKRMFILSRFNKDSTNYNTTSVFNLNGKLDKERLKDALKALINRHEGLRISFHTIEDEPMQKINCYVDFDIEYFDLDNLEDKAIRENIDNMINKFIRPFDLSKAPLFRAKLIKIDSNTHILITDIHHIISDGVSQEILTSELIKLYCLKELPHQRIQYKDYVMWQKEQVKTDKYKKQKEYWLELFKGEIPILNMPTDYQRPKIQSFEGDSVTFDIDKETKEQLQKIAKEHNATLYMILLAAYNTLLYKYTGQEDIVIGSPIVGRTHSDLENVVGMFVNTLVMRNYPKADKTFKEFLLQVKENTLKAFKNQDYQFDDLVSKLNIKRNASRNPLFDTMFVMQNNSVKKVQLNDLIISERGVKKDSSKFDMTLEAVEVENGISFNLDYCTKLYKKETIYRLNKHFINLLNQIANNPEIKINEIDVLTQEEKNQMLTEFNNTKSFYPKEKTVHELFEEQVEKTPEEIAVVYEDKKITYKELNEKANQIARILRLKGVKADEVVAVMLERSIDMIVCIMAVLKAGGAYMPIDPQYPKARITYMIKDSNVKILLTQKDLINMEDDNFGIEMVIVEDEIILSQDGTNLCSIGNQDSLVYVIYTSGSTGKPKGVMIKNYNVVHLIHGLQERIYNKYNDNLKIALVAPYVFDASVNQIFPSLLLGHSLFIVPEHVRLNGNNLMKYYIENSIEITDGTPTHIKMLLESNQIIEDGKLKEFVIGGESLSPKIVKKFIDKFKNYKPIITNVYGPTECCDITTTYTVKYEKLKHMVNMPIGKPITNAKVYITNKDLKLQPIGVPGELCISGDGLSRGYLNRPQLTEEKFILNPFEHGVKMYRTGDLARWLPDGKIEFLGRIDNQIKIRGFRIELGEIENSLLKHEVIEKAVVLARQDEKGDKYLCGYIVAKKELTVSSLREFLSSELPNYMIPSYFVQIKEIPLKSNGKIDRTALMNLNTIMTTGIEYEAPTNETQKKLVSIYKEILGLNKIGINDNFFDLGGHSLKATILISKIHKEFNVQIQMQEIFTASTIKEISKCIDNAKKNIYSSIRKVEKKAYYPLSSAQKRMYAINQINKNTTNYNMPSVFNVEGKLDILKLKKVFKELIYRHESLRTSFDIRKEQPVQIINEKIDFEIEYQELNNANEENNASITNIAREFVRPFNLEKAPLVRVGLVKVDKEKYILMIDMHHIISDGVSSTILKSELSKLYNGEKLDKVNIQYKDYVLWQQEQFQTAYFKEQEKYWLEKFKGELPILNLPTDYKRPSVQGFEGHCIDFAIDNELKQKLLNIAKENNITLYMILLAAYNILLYKYTGQEDIIIGSPIAGRQHDDLENIIGVFINSLAMRNYPNGDKTFIELLKEVQENSLKAYENQDYQFEELVEKLKIKRDMSRNPLFDTMFVLQNLDTRGLELEGLKIIPYEFKTGTSKFDILLRALVQEKGMKFNLECSISLFKIETVKRLKDYFINILNAIAENSTIKLNDINMITDNERKRILCNFNNTKIAYPTNKTVHELFEEQAKKIPDEIAVIYEDDKITYKELNEKVNKLARTLRDKNIKHNDVVAIMTERSVEMIVCILSVLKAGGAYLPVDPKYPTTRIKYMLNDSNAKILLTQNILINTKSYDFDIETVIVDDDSALNQDTTNLSSFSNQDSLVYVIYTSGSTGKPKGVMIKNNNVVNLVYGLEEKIYKKYQNRLNISLVAPYVFDASVKQIFPSLLLGHSLYIVPEDVRLSGYELLNYYIKNSIEITDGTPMHLKMLSELKLTIKDTKLKEFLIGGESLSHTEVMNFLNKFEDNMPVITNVYGPTECCDITTVYSVDYNKLKHIISIPIGKPIANVNVYIVDNNLNLQPLGVRGELCISGNGLSIGYLNSHGLTERKFINNPFNDGTKMYRTGDLVKWLPDGNIEFLGRMDNQVKIRGYRIELGEIKIVLEKFKSIKSAVVLVKKDKSIGDQLVSYLVVREGLKIKQEELKNYIKSKLPAYMIPTKFTIIDKIPLTTNGKIDKKELVRIKGEQINLSNNNEPSNWIEELMMNIWTDILKAENVGVDDEFFELGGHSLLATRLISKIRSSFKVDLPISDVFEYTTIASLSRKVQKEMKKGQGIKILELKKFDYNKTLPLSFAQQRLWFYNQLEPNSPLYNVPKIMRMNGNLKLKALEDSFNKVINRHEIFRTTFREIDGEAVQVIDSSKKIKIDISDLRSYSQNEVEDLAFNICKEKVKEVFDLSKGPLLKVNLLWLKDKEYILIINMHHIICDGWSIGNMLHELQAFYTAYIKENKECLLADLPIQYADFTLWQRKWLQGELLEKGIGYWQRKLSGKLPILELSTNNKSMQNNKNVGAVYEFSISKQLSDILKELSRKKGTTLFMTLLAAFKTLLYRYTEQTDIIIGTPIANRNRSEVEKLIGFFVNTLVLRTDLSGNPTFDELLFKVREVALEAYMHQDIPFEKIVEKLKPERHADVSPLFQVMFSLQNTPAKVIKLPELTLRSIEVHNESAKFDLYLSIEEKKDGLNASFEYKTDLFDDKTIQCISEDYQTILENITKNPQQRISSIPMCSDVVDLESSDLDDIFA